MSIQLPPFDADAEEAAIACILVQPDTIFSVQNILRPDDFFRDPNRWVYEACLALWERNDPITQVSVSHELLRRGLLDEAGGPGFLSRIVGELPTAIGAEHYARIVQRDAIYRNLIGATQQIAQMAYEGGPELAGVLGRAESLITSLRNADNERDFTHVRQLLEKYLDTPGIDAVPSDQPNVGAVRAGFIDLDTLLGGMKRADLVIVAARPSLGKTSLALNIARNAAIGQGSRVAVFSLEMSADQLAQRLLSAEAGVDSQRLRLGEHTEQEEHRIMNAMGILAEAEIYIDDVAVQRVSDLRAKAHRLHKEKPLDLVVVDYLQLIQGTGGRNANRVSEVSDISRALKGLARELNAVVLACSQLSRAPEQRVPHIPILSDLRESGSIEQDADTVVFIYRDDVYLTEEQWQAVHPDRPYPQGIAQLIVAKHRNGPTGTIHLRFKKQLTLFEDLVFMEPYAAQG